MREAIGICDLSFRYQPGLPLCLRGIGLSVQEGDFLGIVGQNGSGKTTLVKLIAGLLRPDTGEIRLAGTDVRETPLAERSATVGFVMQNPDRQLFADTVVQEVAFGLRNQGMGSAEAAERAREVLSRFGLEPLGEEYPPALSKGDRAKVVIASVLAMEPRIIILDEPTGGQDHDGRTQIMEMVRAYRERGHTVLVVTHEMSLVASYCERVLVMSGGEILMVGSAREVFSAPDRLRTTAIRPPQITELGWQLREELGGGDAVLRVEELGDRILERIHRETPGTGGR